MSNKNARPALMTRGTGNESEPPQSNQQLTENQITDLVRKAIDVMRGDADQVIELRALEVPSRSGRPATIAGWFDDHDALAREAAKLDKAGAPAVYITLNPVNPQLLGRANNQVITHPKATTTDRDITRRIWLPIDIDPVRPAHVSAMPKQIEAARQRMADVASWLTSELGTPPTLRGFSGNGFHLLFRVDLANTAEATEQIKGLIASVAEEFDDDVVKVDRTVFNAARIWKLYGTMARKGVEVPRLGMLHRRAALLDGEVRESC